MGRNRTGICTTKGSLRIELSYLLKNGYLEKGKIISGSLSWTSGASISIICHNREKERSIQLIYQVSKGGGEKVSYDYKVQLIGVPSNLGKGEILYFLCPQSSKRCRILYSAYSSGIFKSRETFKHRIYYSC